MLAEDSKFDEAAALLRNLLLVRPDDVEVLFLLANVQAAHGDLEDALSLLELIPPDHPEAGLPALGQSADWCFQLRRYDEAERQYQTVLDRVPGAVPALRKLAFLFNCQGRRQEAAECIRELCRLGNVRRDELHSLIVLNHAMYDPPDTTAGPGDVVYRSIGSGGRARKLFTDGRFDEAADELETMIETAKASPAILAFYGRIVTEAQDDERFFWWLSQTDEKTQQFADYWAAIGTFLISRRRFDEATGALLEALDRDPTDLNSAGRIVQTLATLGDDDASQRWSKRWAAINECVKANNLVAAEKTPNPDDIDALASRLDDVHRPLEAVMWRSIASHYRGEPSERFQQWNERRMGLVQAGRGFPSGEQRLCKLDRDAFKRPDLQAEIHRPVTRPVRKRDTAQAAATIPRFANVARQVGLNHRYQVASQPQDRGFAIYQTLGGAVVILDYDLDGHSDLFFTQGGSDPPDFQGEFTNQMFRQVDACLLDVTLDSGLEGRDYSLGATAGDWNQDGFPDLVVSDLQQCKLMINRGDGTFETRPLSDSTDEHRLPSSSAMADVTGDALPDIVEVTYIDDAGMIVKPKRNSKNEVVEEMLPFQFAPGVDRYYENDGAGGTSMSTFEGESDAARLGLGLVITDFDDRSGNEVFVGNDVHPDSFWVREASSGQWSDIAPVIGCAYGVRGSKTASMGIAAGDLDHSGTIDLHITNFQDRNSSIFVNLGGTFLERNVQFGMARDSQSVLGWGTQTLDYDNDANIDLVVTNGHIDNAVTIDAPFLQPPQLFCYRANRYVLTDVDDPTGYWASNHVGRGLARVDFDRNGKNDFVITHLGESSALLINQSETRHHWLQLRLVGVASERDAVGAKVQIRFANLTRTEWVTAGDGYFSKNESLITFGLADASKVDEIVVTWPSGSQQILVDIAADARFLIVENEQEPFPLSRPHR